MEKNNNQAVIGIIISIFVAVLVGVVLLNISADQVNGITAKAGYTEVALTQAPDLSVSPSTAAVTVTEAPTGWKAGGECPLTNFVLKNSTGSAFTVTTDYVVDLETGIYTLTNSTAIIALTDTGANVTQASYTYCPDGYQTGFGKTTLDLVPGFFALAIMVSVAFLIFWILRREGIVDI